MEKHESFLRRRLVRPVLNLLRQGITPGRLALSLAFGCTIGIFPALGLTSLLCIVVAAMFRLNHAAIQLTNWIVYPLQFILLIPFVRLGERLFGADPLPLSVGQIAAVAKEHPLQVFTMFGTSLLEAMAGWMVVGLPLTALIYFALLSLLRRALRKTSATADASAQIAP